MLVACYRASRRCRRQQFPGVPQQLAGRPGPVSSAANNICREGRHVVAGERVAMVDGADSPYPYCVLPAAPRSRPPRTGSTRGRRGVCRPAPQLTRSLEVLFTTFALRSFPGPHFGNRDCECVLRATKPVAVCGKGVDRSSRSVRYPFGVALGELEHVHDDDGRYGRPQQDLGQVMARGVASDGFGRHPSEADQDDRSPQATLSPWLTRLKVGDPHSSRGTLSLAYCSVNGITGTKGG